MKITLTFFLIICSIINLNAKCSLKGISVFPSGNFIRKNPIIIIDGNGISQNVITELNHKFPVYLVGEKRQIKLIVKEILIGQFGQTQAILLPETNLKVGLKYTLVIEKLPKDQSLYRWNKKRKKKNQ